MEGAKVTGIDVNYTEAKAIDVIMSYTNFRNLSAVVFRPMDFVIGPKIYISTALTIINLYLGTLTYSLSINRIYWVRMSLIIGQILFRTVFVPLDVVFRLVAAKNLTEWNRA